MRSNLTEGEVADVRSYFEAERVAQRRRADLEAARQVSISADTEADGRLQRLLYILEGRGARHVAVDGTIIRLGCRGTPGNERVYVEILDVAVPKDGCRLSS